MISPVRDSGSIGGTLVIDEGDRTILVVDELSLRFPNGREVPFHWTQNRGHGTYEIRLNEDPDEEPPAA
jgi:hypothetical protein